MSPLTNTMCLIDDESCQSFPIVQLLHDILKGRTVSDKLRRDVDEATGRFRLRLQSIHSKASILSSHSTVERYNCNVLVQ